MTTTQTTVLRGQLQGRCLATRTLGVHAIAAFAMVSLFIVSHMEAQMNWHTPPDLHNHVPSQDWQTLPNPTK